MSSLNKVMLIGNLGNDPEIIKFESGQIAKFSIATSESYTSKQTGEKVTNTEWHNIVVRGKSAEVVEKYLSKGDKVYIEGSLKTRSWETEGGEKRYATEIDCRNFVFLSQKPEGGSGPAPAKGSKSAPPKKARPGKQQFATIEQGELNPEEHDDLPF